MKKKPLSPSIRRPFFARFAAFILATVGVATPLLFYGAYKGVRSNTNKVVDWLPATYEETSDLEWFRRHFDGDQFVIISWDGCRLGDDPRQGMAQDDPRIERLARALDPRGSPEDSGQRYFESVTTARRMLDRLTSEPISLSYDAAVRRLIGSLIGPEIAPSWAITHGWKPSFVHFQERHAI